jgi:hypothetical protein
MRETQCGPWHGGRRGSLELGGSGGALDRGRGGEGRGAHQGLICAHSWGREALGGGLRRWPAVPAAGASAPVKGRHRQCIPRYGEVVWGYVKLLGCLVVGGRVGR